MFDLSVDANPPRCAWALRGIFVRCRFSATGHAVRADDPVVEQHGF